jgi:ubiquinone/menaquinone biosynthesis C-methylase UbiE
LTPRYSITCESSVKPASPLAWDYSELASTYDHRADYDAGLVAETLRFLNLRAGDTVVEVGAGTGKLTKLLCRHGLDVCAIEPNDNMREIGRQNQACRQARWAAAQGESLPLAAASMALAAFGSSFNVLEPNAALNESARVLRPEGHWLALWNHRDLTDPLQRSVEAVIREHMPTYSYGRRRQDPKEDIERHGAFTKVTFAERRFTVRMQASDWLIAWRSHATLIRQAGDRLPAILSALQTLIDGFDTVSVPYATRVWTACLRQT